MRHGSKRSTLTFTTTFLSLLLPLLLLTACGSYRVMLGESVLYSPSGVPATPSLLSDANLQGCLNQVFITSGNNDPASVKLLACPSAGVQSLAGIGVLVNLEQLELSDNTVSDLSPLQNLRNLRVLSIRNNRIGNINTLLSLPILRFVALQGNNAISCRQLEQLEEKLGNSLNRPGRCSN